MVYYLTPLDTTRRDLFTAGIYLGNHPNIGSDTITGPLESLRSELLGQSAVWTLSKRDSTYLLQTIADVKRNEGWHTKIHAFGTVAARTDIIHLQTIFATLTRLPPKPRNNEP